MRGQFMWRIGCFFLFMAVVVVSVVALLAWLIGTVIGATGASFATVLIGLAVLFGLALVARAVRRAAAPVGDLIEASDAWRPATSVPASRRMVRARSVPWPMPSTQ
jgi:hypothetical protein